MDVIATQKGHYGHLRERGDTFTLAKKGDFSERWMVKADSSEAKEIYREISADSRGLNAAQVAMEEAIATGRDGTSDAKLQKMQEQIEALTAALNAKSDAAPATPAEGGTGSDGSGDEVNEKADEANEGDDDGKEPARKSRRTRR